MPRRIGRASLFPLTFAILIAALALPPRILETDRFVTTDELFWIGRTANFGRALTNGQLDQTFQSGHPGVTTMWMALLGIGPDRALALAGGRRTISRREVGEHPAFMPALGAARQASGLVAAAGIGLAALLAWRLFGAGPAVLGGGLLALDPFLLAHSRLVHVDAPLAIWTTLALLGGLARGLGGPWPTIALAGVATGLALLSKAPALILLGFVPLTLILVRRPMTVRAVRGWRDLALWAGIAGATYVALWPALWAAPIETFGQILAFVRDNANPDHAAAAGDGLGPWYYGLVLLLRSTPLVLGGLLLLAVARPSGPSARAATLLALFAGGFGLAMTVSAKNADRYLLPALPALDLLAGLGWWGFLARVVPPSRRTGALVGSVVAIVAATVWWIAAAWPYGLTYANSLAGGPAAARATIASGWGEGLDQVARYLNGRPNASRLKVGMPGEIYTTVLGAQLRGQVGPIPAEEADAGVYDYVVVYNRNDDLGESASFFDERFLRWEPEAVVSLSGVESARIYNSALGAPVRAQFGDLLALEGYGLEAATVRAGRRVDLRLRWRPLQALPPDLRLLVELRSPAGPVVARDLLPLLRDGAEAPELGKPVRTEYALTVDGSVTAGPYALAVRVLDADGRPLALTRRPDLGPEATAEADAVVLRGVRVR